MSIRTGLIQLISLRDTSIDNRHRLMPSLGMGKKRTKSKQSSVNEGRLVDALVLRGDEGRGTLRKAAGRGERPLIRGYPNGETHTARCIPARGSEPGELKHLSTRRKGHQKRLR